MAVLSSSSLRLCLTPLIEEMPGKPQCGSQTRYTDFVHFWVKIDFHFEDKHRQSSSFFLPSRFICFVEFGLPVRLYTDAGGWCGSLRLFQFSLSRSGTPVFGGGESLTRCNSLRACLIMAHYPYCLCCALQREANQHIWFKFKIDPLLLNGTI